MTSKGVTNKPRVLFDFAQRNDEPLYQRPLDFLRAKGSTATERFRKPVVAPDQISGSFHCKREQVHSVLAHVKVVLENCAGSQMGLPTAFGSVTWLRLRNKRAKQTGNEADL
jgi:hypothetical protein